MEGDQICLQTWGCSKGVGVGGGFHAMLLPQGIMVLSVMPATSGQRLSLDKNESRKTPIKNCSVQVSSMLSTLE